MTRLTVPVPLAASALALIAAVTASPLSAQTQTVDHGVLLVMRDGEVVGREEFAVRGGTTSATAAGYTVASTALYPADRPERSLVSVVELGPDSFPTAVRLEIGNGEILRVAVGVGPRRITVRRGTATSESAREYPARERPIVLDDSVFAPLAIRPPGGRASRRLSLHGTLSDPIEVVDRGVESTLVAEARRSLQHVSLRFAGESVEAWYDESGRLVKIDWPGRRIRVIREPDR
jgi:hypothetical protein